MGLRARELHAGRVRRLYPDWVRGAGLITAFVLAAVGCAHAGEGGQQPPSASTPASLGALLVGRLQGDAVHRCAWIGTRGEGVQVRWPRRYRIRFEPLRVEDARGRIVARWGDWIRMGGGIVDRYRPIPTCPGGDQPGMWLPAKIEFLGKNRPPEAHIP